MQNSLTKRDVNWRHHLNQPKAQCVPVRNNGESISLVMVVVVVVVAVVSMIPLKEGV